MKILYVGDRNPLSQGILQRMNKEGHEVFLLTRKRSDAKKPKEKDCRVYEYDQKSSIHNIFLSAGPEAVVFAGSGSMDPDWTSRQKENLSLMAELLEESRIYGVASFTLLSTTEVYGNLQGEIDEDAKPQPDTVRGCWMLQCENMLRSYHSCHNMQGSILRLGPVFGETLDSGCRQWLTAMDREARMEETPEDCWLQPVCVKDVADALVRVLDSSAFGVYNVCASAPIRKSLVLALLRGEKVVPAQEEMPSRTVSNERIKHELEWVDFWPFPKFYQENGIRRTSSPKTGKKKAPKKSDGHSLLRRTIENLILLAVFTLLYIFSGQHQLFTQVHWMLIYVMIISLTYGVRQGTLSVLFASAVYLYVERGNIFEMTNFYSYVANVIVIVEFIFFGIVIGYVVDDLRERVRICTQQNEELEVSYAKLQSINEKNLFIKNEYEKRLLQSKNTLPNLYAIISKINVLDTDRIFVELLQVVKELLHTDTVAIYMASPDSSYLRLVTSLNKESVMENRSWDLSKLPHIRQAIADNGVFEGDVWKKEPAIVMSIPYEEGSSVVLVIKKVPMEQMSLYYINMLRTLFMLVSESMKRASQFDLASRDAKYVKDTDILLPNEFSRVLALSLEKQKREVADYMLLRIQGTDALVEKYHRVESAFRDLDQFGSDARGNLYVLLSNASGADRHAILKRLAAQGVEAELSQDLGVEDFQ